MQRHKHIVPFRPYQGAKKRKQVASSTKRGLGENIVLRLMECLTPIFSFDIFMDNYFTYFRLLTHLGVNNIRATGMLNKNRLRKGTITGDKQLQKRNMVTLKSAHQTKKQCNFDQNNSRAVCVASSESCELKRFVRCQSKVERQYIKK